MALGHGAKNLNLSAVHLYWTSTFSFMIRGLFHFCSLLNCKYGVEYMYCLFLGQMCLRCMYPLEFEPYYQCTKLWNHPLFVPYLVSKHSPDGRVHNDMIRAWSKSAEFPASLSLSLHTDKKLIKISTGVLAAHYPCSIPGLNSEGNIYCTLSHSTPKLFVSHWQLATFLLIFTTDLGSKRMFT